MSEQRELRVGSFLYRITVLKVHLNTVEVSVEREEESVSLDAEISNIRVRLSNEARKLVATYLGGNIDPQNLVAEFRPKSEVLVVSPLEEGMSIDGLISESIGA